MWPIIRIWHIKWTVVGLLKYSSLTSGTYECQKNSQVPSCLASSQVIEIHRGCCLLTVELPFVSPAVQGLCLPNFEDGKFNMEWGLMLAPCSETGCLGLSHLSWHFCFNAICWVWQSKLKRIKEPKLLLCSDINCVTTALQFCKVIIPVFLKGTKISLKREKKESDYFINWSTY